jgi:glycosyltransferase involved in cell wall biosynthesis
MLAAWRGQVEPAGRTRGRGSDTIEPHGGSIWQRALKVVHLELGRHRYGGAEQVLYLLGALSDPARHVLLAGDGSAVESAARERGLSVRTVPLAGEHDLAGVGRIARVLREERAGLLHVHSRRGADWMGALAAHRCGVPAVLSRRVDNPPGLAIRWCMRRRYRRVVCISDRIAAVLRDAGIPPSHLETIPSAVDPAPYAAPDPDALRDVLGHAPRGPVIGVVAQLIARKGHRFLIEALPAVRERQPDVQVIFFGRGPLRGELESRVARAGLAGVVHFAGFREDLPRLLGNLALVVHPATAEGLGVSLLQAAAAAVPVVAFAAGGVPQAVADGETGRLVPPGDVAALGAAIAELLGDGAERKRLGRAGRERVQRDFSPAVLADRHRALYRAIEAEIDKHG